MPASTSETAARLLSTSGSVEVDSTGVERLVAVIGRPLVSRVCQRGSPPHDESLTVAIRTSDFDRIGANMRQGSIFRGTRLDPSWELSRLFLPALLEAGAEALVGGAERGLADRA